ncbi:MAG: bifunctional UDP-3-O-[3-hydroxymyristoyl] N-acetylglucosamine deacetylase/3-hydroxyacyl-ACP dehydratase [Gemmatimonadota bacterium]|nr:bifunctional UDP-3-O-[3-hydroxymyristoyl] N-acetylglucosamine deacetylase/3-hydroxyacyl-ACP dehydratase [Gemmatimonadota bacterium]
MIPSSDRQRTIARPVTYSGVGLHTGNQCHMTFVPAEADTGIAFVRVDLEGSPEIRVDPDHVIGVERGTSIGADGCKVHTIEHVLAAVAVRGIDNLRIELDANEPPVGDGSSLPFWEALEEAGIEELDAPGRIYRVEEPIFYEDGDVEIVLLPSDRLQVSFSIDFDHPLVGHQFDSFEITPEVFEKEIAPARTFGFLHEIEQLKAAGLIRGGNLRNAIVIGEDKILNEERLRFPNELVRHKILDLLGDLKVLNVDIQAHIVAQRSGHRTHLALVQILKRRIEEDGRNGRGEPRGPRAAGERAGVEKGEEVAEATSAPPARRPVLEVGQILELLPHRYPFLLVDRIEELEEAKRIVGIKNVTISEPFFQGHFPGHPVMPGVLIVEAMGQVGGLLLMSMVDDPDSKVVYFTGLDSVRFRQPVRPGDTLVCELELLRRRGPHCKMRGLARVGDGIVAEAELMASVVPK